MLGLDFLKDVAYGGVDHDLPGNGGQECVDFLSLEQRVYETIFMEVVAFCILLKSFPKVSLPEKLPPSRNGNGVGKRWLLVMLAFTFGLEVGFKLATKSIIYLLNPCHVLTTIQVNVIRRKETKTFHHHQENVLLYIKISRVRLNSLNCIYTKSSSSLGITIYCILCEQDEYFHNVYIIYSFCVRQNRSLQLM